jgi:hypothetical protein
MEPDPLPQPAPPPHWRPGKPLAITGIVVLSCLFVAALAISAIARARSSAIQAESANKLKQLGFGFQNFDSAQGTLPPHTLRGEDGSKLSNWRFSILPYINQDCYFNANENAYARREPWDSERNLAAIPRMDKEFAAPGIDPTSGLTHYHAFDGDNTPLANFMDDPVRWRYCSKWSVEALAKTQRGTSNLLFCVEAGPPVVWTHPDGLPYAPDRPLPAMEPLHHLGIPVLKVDGSVVVVRPGTAEAVWRAYIDPTSTSDAVFE